MEEMTDICDRKGKKERRVCYIKSVHVLTQTIRTLRKGRGQCSYWVCDWGGYMICIVKKRPVKIKLVEQRNEGTLEVNMHQRGGSSKVSGERQ